MPCFYRTVLEPGYETLLDLALSPRERAQYERLRSERRQRDWLIGRLAAKALLLEYLCKESAYEALEPKDIEIISSPSGVPRVFVGSQEIRKISLSLAHSSGHGFAGLTEIEREGHIGVDLERIRPVPPKLKERILSAEERVTLAERFSPKHESRGLVLLWTLKEAAYKALCAASAASKLSWRDLRVELKPLRGREGRAYIKLSLPAAPTRKIEAGYQLEGDFYRAWALLPR
jgi:phosphopantetheinyl transferase